MPYEHAVDTGLDSDQPLAGHSVGLRFDRAWYVHDLEASDPVRGTATIDVRTLARPTGTVTPVRTLGMDQGDVGGEPPSLFDDQHWQTGRLTDSPRNGLDARLSGTSRVALDLAKMGLTAARPVAASIHTDAHTTVALELPRRTCLTFSADGAAPSRAKRVHSVVATLTPGDHRIKLRPCRSRVRTARGHRP
jgi:hypothetical protein